MSCYYQKKFRGFEKISYFQHVSASKGSIGSILPPHSLQIKVDNPVPNSVGSLHLWHLHQKHLLIFRCSRLLSVFHNGWVYVAVIFDPLAVKGKYC